MSGNYLLDTSILIELFARDKDFLSQLEKASSTFIPSIALGELHYGARKSSRTEKNLEQLEKLATQVVVLPCDSETSYWYGIVKDSPSLKTTYGSQQWRYNTDSLLPLVTNISNRWKT